MAVKLSFTGRPVHPFGNVIGRATHQPLPMGQRADAILIWPGQEPHSDVMGYAGVLTCGQMEGHAPIIGRCADLSAAEPGSVVFMDGRSGFVRVLYRPSSTHNAIFATGRCNSNCIMCPQPPTDKEDPEGLAGILKMLSLIEIAPASMGITGGEPTLLGDGLIEILTVMKERMPGTTIQLLTNGRIFKNPTYAAKIAAIGHPNLILAVPIYADTAPLHDWIVQCRGAFDETIDGLYNLAHYNMRVEIRVVLHKETVPRLERLCEFIFWNLPFVEHIALMGMENMGYVKKNWDTLWIDPVDYTAPLNRAVEYIFIRGMAVSIYNVQLCLLSRDLWAFARQSISDYKNIHLEACRSCEVSDRCCGLFSSQETLHSVHIAPVRGVGHVSTVP
jgi:His-Xaa-Ser system radical SAM maturase HxsC